MATRAERKAKQKMNQAQREGRLVMGDNAPAVREQMVSDWWDARGQGNDALMIALRTKDVDDLNRQLHRELSSYMVERPTTISRCLRAARISGTAPVRTTPPCCASAFQACSGCRFSSRSHGSVEATKVGALSKSQLTAFIDSHI